MTRSAALLVASWSAPVLIVCACSSVPDVVFDDEIQNPDSGEGGEDGGTDGAADAATDRRYSCPDNPPPESEGICCFSRLCAHCNKGGNPCGRCFNERCDGDFDDACCQQSPSSVVCRPFSECN